MKKSEVAISPRIQKSTAAFYESLFPSRNSGATHALETMPMLYAHAMADLQNRFTTDEHAMLSKVVKAPARNGQAIGFCVRDAFKLQGSIYGAISEEDLLYKLSKCTLLERICLEMKYSQP